MKMSVKSWCSYRSGVRRMAASAPSAKPRRPAMASVGPATRKVFRTCRRSIFLSRIDIEATSRSIARLAALDTGFHDDDWFDRYEFVALTAFGEAEWARLPLARSNDSCYSYAVTTSD